MVARQAVKENLQCTSKYGHFLISQDICHVRMTNIEEYKYKYCGIIVEGKSRGDYSTIFTEPEENDCLRIIAQVIIRANSANAFSFFFF